MVSVGPCMLPTSGLRARVWIFLRLKDYWGKAVQGIVLRALWKAPIHLLGDCRRDPVIGKGLIYSWGFLEGL